MYDTSGDIFMKQSLIECYGRIEIKYQLIGLFRKASSPIIVPWSFSHLFILSAAYQTIFLIDIDCN